MDKPHKKLGLWNSAMVLAVDIYSAIDTVPKDERYSLTDQIRRAAVSVPSNMAEGGGSANPKGICQLPAHGTRVAQ
jgi:four helix bundle protein